MISKLWDKLRDPEYRAAFVGSQITMMIPFQIRAMLKSRPGWTQQTLSERTGMRQPRISALMTPGKTRPNIETLRRVAKAFDCGLMVRFVPFSELARWAGSFDPESFFVPSFDQDSGLVERKPSAREGTVQFFPCATERLDDVATGPIETTPAAVGGTWNPSSTSSVVSIIPPQRWERVYVGR